MAQRKSGRRSSDSYTSWSRRSRSSRSSSYSQRTRSLSSSRSSYSRRSRSTSESSSHHDTRFVARKVDHQFLRESKSRSRYANRTDSRAKRPLSRHSIRNRRASMSSDSSVDVRRALATTKISKPTTWVRCPPTERSYASYSRSSRSKFSDDEDGSAVSSGSSVHPTFGHNEKRSGRAVGRAGSKRSTGCTRSASSGNKANTTAKVTYTSSNPNTASAAQVVERSPSFTPSAPSSKFTTAASLGTGEFPLLQSTNPNLSSRRIISSREIYRSPMLPQNGQQPPAHPAAMSDVVRRITSNGQMYRADSPSTPRLTGSFQTCAPLQPPMAANSMVGGGGMVGDVTTSQSGDYLAPRPVQLYPPNCVLAPSASTATGIPPAMLHPPQQPQQPQQLPPQQPQLPLQQQQQHIGVAPPPQLPPAWQGSPLSAYPLDPSNGLGPPGGVVLLPVPLVAGPNGYAAPTTTTAPHPPPQQLHQQPYAAAPAAEPHHQAHGYCPTGQVNSTTNTIGSYREVQSGHHHLGRGLGGTRASSVPSVQSNVAPYQPRSQKSGGLTHSYGTDHGPSRRANESEGRQVSGGTLGGSTMNGHQDFHNNTNNPDHTKVKNQCPDGDGGPSTPRSPRAKPFIPPHYYAGGAPPHGSRLSVRPPPRIPAEQPSTELTTTTNAADCTTTGKSAQKTDTDIRGGRSYRGRYMAPRRVQLRSSPFDGFYCFPKRSQQPHLFAAPSTSEFSANQNAGGRMTSVPDSTASDIMAMTRSTGGAVKNPHRQQRLDNTTTDDLNHQHDTQVYEEVTQSTFPSNYLHNLNPEAQRIAAQYVATLPAASRKRAQICC